MLGIGDKSYDNFCGHAKSLDRRLADLGATKLLERAECEAYDDEPLRHWADKVTTALTGPAPVPAVIGAGARTVIPTEPDEFTRAKPILAALARNELLTAPSCGKEVRQFGFDISEYDVNYAVGDSLGVYASNDPAVVDSWLAATALNPDSVIEVDGVEQALRDALISSYDICRVTPDLLRFVADSCADTFRGQDPAQFG